MISCVYNPGKKRSGEMCRAFVQGCPEAQLLAPHEYSGGPVALYGVQKETKGVWDRVCETRADYWLIDNGYWSDHVPFERRDDRFYRITKNQFHDHVPNNPDWDRWGRLGQKVEKWNTDKDKRRHILILPPSIFWWNSMFVRNGSVRIPYMTVPVASWLKKTVDACKQYSDREIRIRTKPAWRLRSNNPLERDLDGAHCLVTFLSIGANRAICNGIPAFVDSSHVAMPFASNDLSQLDDPYTPGGREEWAGTLAGLQWTIHEIRSGLAWEKICERDGRSKVL